MRVRHFGVMSLILSLTLWAFMPMLSGCGSPSGGALATTQPAQPTKADMVRLATQSERALTIVERGLNEAFEQKFIPASVHPTLTPYLHSAREAVNSMSTAADRGDAASWRTAYDAVMAAMPPLMEAQANAATAKAKAATKPLKPV